MPLALVVLLISLWRVPESWDEEENKQLDWLGAGLTTLGLGMVVYGLIESPGLGLDHPLVLAALVGGALSLAAFLLVEARSRMSATLIGRPSSSPGASVQTQCKWFGRITTASRRKGCRARTLSTKRSPQHINPPNQ